MDRLGIENLSTFGLHPVEFIRLAGELGCGHVSLNLSGSANRLDIYPEVSWRGDVALQRDMARAADDAGVAISLVEGFAILPGAAADFFADLDHAAAMGAKAICAVSLERDITRTHDEFARLTDLAAQRGIVTTTEVGAGVLRNLEKSLAAVAAVAHSGFRLLVDTMHFFRSGSTLADFAALDPAARLEVLKGHEPAALKPNLEKASKGGGIAMMMGPPATDEGYARMRSLIIKLFYLTEPALTQELSYEHDPGGYEPSVPITPESRPEGGLSPI